MQYLQNYLVALSFLAITSCNQGKIDDLEREISKLEKDNKALKSHIEELENAISNYERNCAEYSARKKQREWHQQNAEQHLRTAEFWRQNGDEFLYESSMRQAQNEINMTP
ncbi:MAG: hypothetical protein K2I26_04495 [Paramuribaculum sp.]|nr:hypothetical protein [Paramuribaculum sp.]